MHADWIRALAGGALIGLSASILLLGNGRIAGISGIVAGILSPRAGEVSWRAVFVAGLLVGGLVARAALGGVFSTAGTSLGVALVAGLLVGVGTRLANGCTSGHGVCGLSRFSVRSLVATVTFISAGALTVLASRSL
jgi:uncharacterized protein